MSSNLNRLESIITHTKNYVSEKSKGYKEDLLDTVKDITRKYKPVYRVAITYPTLDGNVVGGFTKIIADTSTATQILSPLGSVTPLRGYIDRITGVGVSEILGMYIDHSDVQEPDKAVVLFKVDSNLTRQSITGDTNVEDEYIAFFKLLAVRNWIDIWVGYETEPDVTNEINEKVSGNIYPEAFTWFGETHLFSGPIMLIDRTMNRNGDRVSITALGPEAILKEAVLSAIIPDNMDTVELLARTSISLDNKYFYEICLELFESLISYTEWERLKKDESDTIRSKNFFVIGDFYWLFFRRYWEYMLDFLRSKGTKAYEYKQKVFPLMDNMVNEKIFTENELFKFKSDIILSKNPSWWDTMMEVLKPERSNLVGLGFKLVKTRGNLKEEQNIAYEGKFIKNEDIEEISAGRRTGHFGIGMQFYFEMDVDELQELDVKAKNKYFPSTDFKSVTIGEDIIDLETYIDYTTCYNSFRILTTTPQTDSAGQFDNEPSKYNFPIDAEKMITNFLKSKDDKQRVLGQFWESVLKDIRVYGEIRFPVLKWFAIDAASLDEARKSQDFGSALSESVHRELKGNVPLKSIMGHEGIAGMFKRYYFGGLEGSVYCIGNPSLKVSRLLQIKDARKSRDSKIMDSLVGWSNQNIATNIGKIKDMLSFERYSVKFSAEGSQPIVMNTQFQDATNKSFWIWKIRHYLGPKSGFLTKVYITQSRSRSWRMSSRDIYDVFKQTYQITRELI